ncbi:MAG: hypothetical protein NTV81_00675, partial [Candidatus Komeilibacteria bacterium]|nr:hypothetical protein [Candidatus Komeilibacteria bacterium]
SVVSGGVRYNATYCLLTNGKIVNFKTQSRNCLRPDYSRINFPEPGNKYQTPLGFLPMNELKTKATKTGTAMEDVSDLNTYFSSTKVLNNRVYYFSGFGDYTISDPITFLNNVASNGSGAGTIVVAGNLHVNANLFYEDSKLIGKIGNLASVAFIVLGDVIIDPAVDHLVGSWLVLGNDSLEACLNGTNICGQFSTGNDTAAPTQLTVQGLVLARKFNLQRNFRQGLEAAEKFIYDGRVNVNTPPGLSSVSFNLPQWNGQ